MEEKRRGEESESKDTIHLVGQSHIDLSWLWPRTETINEVLPNTYRNALRLIQEYPEFRYTDCSAQFYEWVEEYHPQIFEQIKLRVAEGRWEIVGGTWTQHNATIPCGESIVRQCLFGQRYFKEKFGVMAKVGWLPDCFGFAWTLPQIYKQCGIEYFMTMKLNWQTKVLFPYGVFRWRSPDGTTIIATNLGSPIPEGVNDVMRCYGKGDHGGGPSKEEVEEWKKRIESGEPFVFSTAERYFTEIEKVKDKLPFVDDELYVKTHRGTFTTEAVVKKKNREAEALLLNAEKFCSWSVCFAQQFTFGKLPKISEAYFCKAKHTGAQNSAPAKRNPATREKRIFAYPQEILNKAWKRLLLTQVHDNIDGTSIAAVYKEEAEDFAEIFKNGTDALNSALENIASKVDTRGEGTSILIFNPLSWKRSGRIEIKLKDLGDRENIEIIDAEGYIIPSQIVVEQKGEKGVLFIAEDVPPVGYKEYRAASEGVPDASERGYNFLLKAEPEILENEFYKVKIDSTSGCLASIYDKSNQREVLDDSKRGNMIQIYEDMPPDAPAGEPAWNIYLGEMTELYTADNVQVIESGPVRATVQIKKRYGNSTFIQDVTLYRNSPFIEFQIRADWHEHYKTAKLAFPVSFSNDWASYEIPYGVMTRKDPSSESATPEEKEKWEVYAQRWIDLQTKAGDYGVSLINDCKYGFDIQGNVMRMTLLRGPRRAYPGFPDEWADQSNDRLVGEHLIKYALYPHTGDWRMARSVQKGYEFNYPLFARIEPAHEGRLSKSSSFVEISPDNVVLTTIKRAEDSEATLFRFYETAGKNSEVKLKLTEKPLEAYFVDLLERDVTKLIVAGKEISIPIKECEIKTLKVIF